jgi:mannose-6-phosphate isomerase-like protein (cupin superfamily)
MQVGEQLSPTAFARTVDVDSTFAYMGSLMTFLVKASETSGRFALMAYQTKPGNEPPPHVHEREHELYFVLEGTMRFYCEDKTLDVGAGEVVFLPQAKAHAFNCTSCVVRALIFVQATGKEDVGLDSYFLAMGGAAASMVLPESAVTYAVDDPEHASFKTSFSNDNSITRRRRRLFSFSSAFSRRACSSFRSPYSFRQR